ncbi:MAG TPA: DUF1800 family protein, partial [Gemmatimonadaceae bacterium]|nr:DUF1800 family protein [Gemmatimonadaceae bacterium]
MIAVAAVVPSLAFAQRPGTSAPRGAKQAPGSATSSIREQTADQQVMQVLNRLAFGPRPGDAAMVRSIGVDAWLDQQLHPERINDDAMDQMLARYPLLQQDQAALAMQYATAQRQFRLVKRDTANRSVAQDTDMSALKEMRRSHAQ